MSNDKRKGLRLILKLIDELIVKTEKAAGMVASYEADRRARRDLPPSDKKGRMG